MQNQVQVHQRIGSHGLPEHLDEFRIEFTDLRRRNVGPIHEPHSAAEIEGRGDERFFHRQGHASVAGNPGFVPQRLGERLSETNADVFDRVMLIDVKVSLSIDLQVQQRVLGQQRQHVIEESDTRVNLRAAGPVEVQLKLDRGFRSLAANGGSSWHESDRLSRIKNHCSAEPAIHANVVTAGCPPCAVPWTINSNDCSRLPRSIGSFFFDRLPYMPTINRPFRSTARSSRC